MKTATALLICLLGITSFHQGLCHPVDEDYPQDKDGGDNYPDDSDDETGPPPKMLSKSKTFEVDPNSVVTLDCEVQGNPDSFSRVWQTTKTGLYVGQVKQTTDNRFLLTPTNGSLEIHGVTKADEGNYTCWINEEERVTYTIVIYEPARITEFFPDKSSISIKENSTLALRCVASGNPKPEIKWFKNDIEIREKLTVGAGVTYTIEDASQLHSGVYKCSIRNRMTGEPETRTLDVQVISAPEVELVDGEDNIVAGEGYEAVLHCNVTGHPKPQVKWYKDDVAVVQVPNAVTAEKKGSNFYLKIANIKKTDFGSYKCVAKNPGGEASAVISLRGNPKTNHIESRNENETNDPVLVFNTTSFYPIEEYELLYKKQQENDWEALRPSPAVKNPEEGTNVYILEQPIPRLDPGVYVAKLKAKNIYGWSEYSSDITVVKEHADFQPTGESLAAVESSSAELRISAALLISLLVAHFYC